MLERRKAERREKAINLIGQGEQDPARCEKRGDPNQAKKSGGRGVYIFVVTGGRDGNGAAWRMSNLVHQAKLSCMKRKGSGLLSFPRGFNEGKTTEPRPAVTSDPWVQAMSDANARPVEKVWRWCILTLTNLLVLVGCGEEKSILIRRDLT